MRARALSSPRAVSLVAGDERPPSWAQWALMWGAFAAGTLAVAAATAVIAPGWLDGPVRALPDRPLLIADIFVHNLLLALLPLIGGWLAAGHRLAGRRWMAGLFVAVPGLVVARSLFTIGAVGGADPAWLADSARWWALELAALAAASSTGLWLVRHPELRERHSPAALRRALAVVGVTLAAGSVVEVLSA